MTALANFGPIVHTTTVDKAVIAFLRAWLHTYLRASEIAEGRPENFLARPKSYFTTYDEDDDDYFADHALPACIVTTSGFTDWERTGDKAWSANARTAITIISRGRQLPEARLQASMYCATLTNLLLDKPSVGGIAGGVEPVLERPRPLEDPSNRSRVLTAAMTEYDLFLPNVRHSLGGPLGPPPDPDDTLVPMPDVVDVEITWEGVAPGEPAKP